MELNDYQIGFDYGTEDRTCITLRYKGKMIVVPPEEYVIKGKTFILKKKPKDYFKKNPN